VAAIVKRRERRPGERQYGALAANPAVYRVLDAVSDLEVDSWTTKGKDVRAGDRVLIWKYKGRDPYRGIVALGEVLTDPENRYDVENPYWIRPAPQPDERVRVRYVRPPGLPLWVGGDVDEVFLDLSVSKAQGGTVFLVTQEQWSAVVRAAGGWPVDP
jgi:hypothetical protein